MGDQLTIDVLREAVAGKAAAFRSRTELQPAAGPGTKVFPPTFSGAVYATEKRTIPGRDEPVNCVLLDSVQSQANRMEAALQDAVDGSLGDELKIELPNVEVDFSGYDPGSGADDEIRLLDRVGRITSLQAPHRLADAILRDSMHQEDGELQPFRQSAVGRALDHADVRNATPLFELGPSALIFGMWDSTGPKGGLGAKFERALVSEIVGIGCPYDYSAGGRDLPKNRGIRRDPLGIRKEVPVAKASRSEWSVSDGTEEEVVRPSEINHGNVPFDGDNAGVTVEHAEQTTVLSLPVLRRLRFPQVEEDWQPSSEQLERDRAAQTVLAALGLCAAELAATDMDLRSRCLLWPAEPRSWELLDTPGSEPRKFRLGAVAAVELLGRAIAEAKREGLPWKTEPVRLVPSEELVKLVRESQEATVAKGTSGGAD